MRKPFVSRDLLLANIGICLSFMWLNGCALWERRPEAPSAPPRPAGIIRHVNAAERYVVFEALRTFPAGQELHVMRNGGIVGLVEALDAKKNGFQAADLLEGTAATGDVVDPPLPRSQP